MAELKLETIGAIHKIWEEKKWVFPTPDDSILAFNRLCKMMSLLDSDEQELLLNLTRFYSHYSFTDYQGLLIEALAKIGEEHLINVDQIVVAPLVKPGDVESNRSKSGHSLIYVAQHVAIPANPKLAQVEILAHANPILDRAKLKAEKLLVILLDDFVGSGDTAVEAVEHMRGRVSAKDEVVVACLVTMQNGVDRLADAAIPFFWEKLAQGGIKNNPFITDKDHAYKLVDEIWKDHLQISDEYKRGYKKSEALLTLVRTPNNTLPMYWCKKSRDGSDWPSPFSR